MTNLFFNVLPVELVSYVYEMDGTYRETYDRMVKYELAHYGRMMRILNAFISFSWIGQWGTEYIREFERFSCGYTDEVWTQFPSINKHFKTIYYQERTYYEYTSTSSSSSSSNNKQTILFHITVVDERLDALVHKIMRTNEHVHDKRIRTPSTFFMTDIERQRLSTTMSQHRLMRMRANQRAVHRHVFQDILKTYHTHHTIHPYHIYDFKSQKDNYWFTWYDNELFFMCFYRLP